MNQQHAMICSHKVTYDYNAVPYIHTGPSPLRLRPFVHYINLSITKNEYAFALLKSLQTTLHGVP